MSYRTTWQYCACLRRPNALMSSTNWLLRSSRSSAFNPVAFQQLRAIHNDGPKTLNPLINPPRVTRPPPLTLPRRSATNSTVKYWFEVGKGYLRFYKDGLKGVLECRRLLKEKLQRTPQDDRPSMSKPHFVPRTFSRADWVLLWRVRHDMLRLPLFGLLLLVAGEFTALVVVFVDGVVPYTCRIPKQIFGTYEKAEQRRKLAFNELEDAYPHGVLSPRVNQSVARSHVLRTLHLSGAIWDRLGVTPPGMWRMKGRYRMAFLEGDDQNMVEDGGPMGLEYDELRIACAERGIDILGKSETELRGWLLDWLRLVEAEDVEERRRRMTVLLMTRPEHWPAQRDFAVPEWTL